MWGDLSLHLGDGDGDLPLGLDLRLVGSLKVCWGGRWSPGFPAGGSRPRP